MNVFKKVFIALMLCGSLNVVLATGRVVFVVGTSSCGKTAITRMLNEQLENSRLVESDNVHANCIAEQAEKITREDFPRNDKNAIFKKCQEMGIFDAVSETVEEPGEDSPLAVFALRCFAEVRDLVSQDYDVICDMIIGSEEARRLVAEQLEGVDLYHVLAYCSVSELEYRVTVRNCKDQIAEERDVGGPLWDFFRVYRAGDESEFQRFTNFVSAKNATLSNREVDEICDRNDVVRLSSREDCDIYPFEDGLETISIVPRLGYDFIVDNSERNAAYRCVARIMQFLSRS